jgi:hypothetical protein
MSQEKVAKYKEAKANRKELMKKAKQKRTVQNAITAVVCVAVIGWLGYSAVDYAITNQPRQAVEIDFSAIDEYIGSVEK